MANISDYKEGSVEWFGALLDVISRSTYDAIVHKQSEEKITGQLNDAYQLLLNLRSDIGLKEESVRKRSMSQSNYLRSLAEYVCGQTGSATLDQLIWRYRLLEAQNGCLDSYFLYLEKNREPEKRFYEPRRKKFLQFELVQSMEQLIHGYLDAAWNWQEYRWNLPSVWCNGVVAQRTKLGISTFRNPDSEFL